MPAFDASTPAVVLKFDPNVLHHGGLGVIRGLGRFGVPMYCVHEDPLAPAAHSRYLRGRWLWRLAAQDVDQVLDGLARLAERIGRPAVLFPTDDAAAIFLAEHGAELRQWFLFPDPPHDLPRQVAGKYSLYQLCRGLGVPCAEATLVGSGQEAREFADRVGYPVVCKLATPWTSEGGSGVRSTSITHTQQELIELYHRCGTAAVGGLMLQEFIPSDPGGDWFFHGYCDSASLCRPACTGMKERSYPAHSGLTSLGCSAENPRLSRLATDMLARLAYRGIVDLDFRRDARDGEYKLLDFNPRLGAQFRLFQDPEGADIALAAYLDLTGQPAVETAPPAGRRFLVENYDPMAALSYWRKGELPLKTWRASLRRVDETAWFARDDAVPFALMCLWMLWRAVTRPFGRRAHRPPTVWPMYRPGRNRSTAARTVRYQAWQRPVQEDRV